MKKIVIIGANEFQNPLILKAKMRGYETHVFSWKAGDVGETTADVFYPISIVEKDKILEKCIEIEPEGIVSIGSDLAVLTVNYLQRKLGKSANSEESDRVSTNKYLMREAFSSAGIPTPQHSVVESSGASSIVYSDLEYPLIVKPVDRSGSRAIQKVENNSDLVQAIDFACRESFSNQAIVEEYIVGEEYSCECLSFEGKHWILAYTKKYTTGAPHFIEMGHDEPSGISEAISKKAERMILDALDALEIRYGASHAEFIVTPSGNIRIVEIGARMGGDCIGSDLVPLSTGYDYVGMVIDIACGKSPCFDRTDHYSAAGVRFVFSEEDIKNFQEKLERVPETRLIRKSIRPIDPTKVVCDSSTRFGYYIFAESPLMEGR